MLKEGKPILLERTPHKLQYLAQWRIFTHALCGKGFFFHTVWTPRVGAWQKESTEVETLRGSEKNIFILSVIAKENYAALQQPQQKGVSGSIISFYHRYVTWTIAQIYKS